MTSSNQVVSIPAIYTPNNTSLTFIKSLKIYNVVASLFSSDEKLRLRDIKSFVQDNSGNDSARKCLVLVS